MTLKPFRLVPFILLPFGPALAQQAPDIGLIRSFMEGCLQASGGDAEAMETCKCTAKLIFPGPGTAGEEDPMAAMMQCSPGMRAMLRGG
jgi:hypothetical protein